MADSLDYSRGAMLIGNAREAAESAHNAIDMLMGQLDAEEKASFSESLHFTAGWGLAQIASNFRHLAKEIEMIFELMEIEKIPPLPVFDDQFIGGGYEPSAFLISFDGYLSQFTTALSSVYDTLRAHAIEELSGDSIDIDQELRRFSEGSGK